MPVIRPGLQRRDLPWITPDAVGDGVADDTAAVQQALIDAAAVNGKLLLPAGKTYRVTDYVWIHNGIREISAFGAEIVFDVTGAAGLRTVAKGTSQNGQAAAADQVNNLAIYGLGIDGGDHAVDAVTGLYLWQVRDVFVRGCRIRNIRIGSGITVYNTGVIADGACKNVVIEDNDISLTPYPTSTAAVYGVSFATVLTFTDPYTDVTDQWKALHVAAVPAAPTEQCAIIDNRIIGGYYAISLSGVKRSTIKSNVLSNNARNISIQNGSVENVVSENSCRESESSSIHMALASSRNHILNNSIRSEQAGGEALIQMYIGCEDNVVERNTISCPATGTGPAYAIYAAVHANRNKIRNNTITGKILQAAIAVESAWVGGTSIIESRGYQQTSVVNGYGAAATDWVEITGNIIDLSNAVTAICLMQVTDTVGGVCPITNVQMRGNIVTNDIPAGMLKLYEDDSGSLSGLIAVGNQFPALASASKFLLPRGRNHFIEISGNTVLNAFEALSAKRHEAFIVPASTGADVTVGTFSIVVRAYDRVRAGGGAGSAFWAYAKLIAPDGTDVTTSGGMSNVWRWPGSVFGGLGRFSDQVTDVQYAELVMLQDGTLTLTMQTSASGQDYKTCNVEVRGA